MYISGIGRTKFGVNKGPIHRMIYSAMCDVLNDSNKSINNIDAIIVSNFLGGPLQGQLHNNALIASLLPGINLPIYHNETACASGGAAFNQALHLLNKYENVMIVGFEKMNGTTKIPPIEALTMAEDFELGYEKGLIFPAAYALIAQMYLDKYSVNHEILEMISYNNHINANLNPNAQFYEKNVTMDMIKQAKMVSSPLTLFDCSPLSDGAVAVIISNNKVSDRDVKILSSELITDSISIVQRKDLTSFPATKIAARKAFEYAHIKPQDIDILEVHDCFTISELIALEDLGICAAGKAHELIKNEDITLKGSIPVNTDGGLKANGHPIGATGLAQIFEIVTQLRKEAGRRQVESCEIGVCQNIGGIGSTSVVSVLGV